MNESFTQTLSDVWRDSFMYMHDHSFMYMNDYGVATISRLLKILGLFCRISSLLLGSFATETYNFKESTNRSHPIPVHVHEGLLLHVWFVRYSRESRLMSRLMSRHHSGSYAILVRRGGGLGSRPKKCTGRDWGMGLSTI